MRFMQVSTEKSANIWLLETTILANSKLSNQIFLPEQLQDRQVGLPREQDEVLEVGILEYP